MGDSRGPISAFPINTIVLESLVDKILLLNPRPSFILFLGDLAYNGGTADLNSWKAIFEPLTSVGVKIYPTVGNHELTIGHGTGQQDYKNAFNLPTNGPAGYEELVYSFEESNALFACVDAYYDDGTYYENLITAVQQSWLSNLLSSSSKTFKFVFGHTPAYPCSGHVGTSLDAHPTERDSFWEILDDNQVAMFFAGHEHIYSRFRITSAINSSWHHNVVQIISGGAGAPLYPITDPPAGVDVVQATFNYSVIDISANTLNLNTYNYDNTLIDSYSLTK